MSQRHQKRASAVRNTPPPVGPIHGVVSLAGGEAPDVSEQIESWLASRGVEYSGPTVMYVSDINESASRSNQARAVALDTGTVERYAQAFKAGAKFPPLVVYPRGQGYVIVDGNHRQAAYKKVGQLRLLAYVVNRGTASELIELLTAEANTRHGDPTPLDWRQHQALYLLALGHPMEVVSSALGITQNAISVARRVAQLDDRARHLRIAEWETLSMSAREHLGRIPTDNVFREAARNWIEFGSLVRESVAEYAKNIRRQPGEEQAMAYIGIVSEEGKAAGKTRKATGKHSSIANPKMQVLAALGQIMAIDVAACPRLFLTEEEREEVRSRAEAAAERLMEMEQLLRV